MHFISASRSLVGRVHIPLLLYDGENGLKRNKHLYETINTVIGMNVGLPLFLSLFAIRSVCVCIRIEGLLDLWARPGNTNAMYHTLRCSLTLCVDICKFLCRIQRQEDSHQRTTKRYKAPLCRCVYRAYTKTNEIPQRRVRAYTNTNAREMLWHHSTA